MLRKEKIFKSALKDAGLDGIKIEEIINKCSAEDPFIKAQEDLISNFKRTQYLRNEFKLIEPDEIILNKEEVKMGFKKDCIHYVPITESLKVLVQDETFIKVHSKKASKGIAIEEIVDAEAFNENIFFKQNCCDSNSEVLPLLLYSDAVELVNPLGAGRSKHKITQVFWCVGSLPRRHRSQIDKLQLVLVFKEKLLKKYGYAEIFKKFISDLKILESEGITVMKPYQRCIKAGVLLYSADNLEQHLIGGFSASFSSGYICRMCHIKYDELTSRIHDYSDEEPHVKWSVDEYDHIVSHLKSCNSDDHSSTLVVTMDNLFNEFEEPTSGDLNYECDLDLSSAEEIETYGVKEACVFNCLSSFHCTQSMPCDLMHDLFEGIIAQDLLAIIRTLVADKWFTLEEYNNALSKFPLSRQESSNKPQPVPVKNSTKKLVGKAVSLWCHLRFFLPILLINDWIKDIEADIISLAVLLTEMTQRLTAEKFETYEIDVLEDLIIKYLDLRCCIEEVNDFIGTPKPKHHFVTHYTDVIRLYGPPLGFWTARYESKHRVAKSISESGKNFINISKTVAERQQLRMASIYYHGMYSAEDLVLPEKLFKKSQLPETEFTRNLISFMERDDLACKSVTWRDRLYQTDDLVVLNRVDSFIVSVGVIRAFVIKGKETFILVRRARMRQHSFKFFQSCFIDDVLVLVNIVQLQDTYPLFLRGNESSFYAIPHHHISFTYD